MKTLGVFIAMDGNSSAQKELLKEKAKTFAEKLRTSQCEPNTAIYAYNTCFIESMEYCMPVTNFTKEEWKSIVSPAKTIVLQKARMSHSFPSKLLYGSTQYNGFFFEEPFIKQGIEKISHFMQEVSDQSHTGKINTMGAENYIQDLGFSVDIAENSLEQNREVCLSSMVRLLSRIHQRMQQRNIYPATSLHRNKREST